MSELLIPVLVLAVVQGITEFLPISSDGHLTVVAAAFAKAGHPLPDVLGVTILLHAGTLLSIIVYFWRRLWKLLGADRRVLGLIVIGTIPAAVGGLLAKKFMGEMLESPLLAGLLLPVNGLILLWGSRMPEGTLDYHEISPRNAFQIGVAQLMAILPGISRSGSTIVAGVGNGMQRAAAAQFSFLLAVPAVGGACLLEAIDMVRDGHAKLPWELMIVGPLVSFVVGLAALSWLFAWLRSGRLHLFAWWCIGLGIVVLAWQLMAGPTTG